MGRYLDLAEQARAAEPWRLDEATPPGRCCPECGCPWWGWREADGWLCPLCQPGPAGTAAATWARPGADPRPDRAEDAGLWSRLLAAAWRLDGAEPAGLYGALHGLRCLGARLAVDGGRVKLLAGSVAAASYAADRERWLLPHAAALTGLLADLASAGATP